MKKLLIVIPILIAIGATAVVASVWQYGSYQDRAEMAAMCGIFGYRGTAQQNLSKEVQDCFKTFSGEYLGFSVITRYRTTLSSSMTSSQTTIPVSSMKTFDGDTITMAMLGSKVYLTVEPGSNREEIIKCTGISGSSWTGCTRGLAFSGTDESSVVANRKAHNAGSTVVISNVHYVYEELIDKDSNNTSTAKIISKDMLATSTMCLYDTNYCFRVNDGMIQWTVDNFTNSYNFTSSTISQLTASSTRAIGVTDSKIHLNISDDGGLAFDSSTGYLETLLNNSITSGTDGLAVNTSTDFTWTGSNSFTGNNSFTSTTTFTGNMSYRGFGGVGTDGALSISAGATTTLDANYTNVLVKNYSSINIPNTAGLTIQNASTTGTILILKSQGDCNIAGNIWLKGFGAATSSATTTPFGVIDVDNKLNGRDDGGTIGASGGNRISSSTLYLYTTGLGSVFNRSMVVVPGAHGGRGSTGGGVSGGAGGYGGSGGGAIIIECGGYLNFTGSIVVDGGNGLNGSDGGAASAGGGGGGGGAAGMALVLYNNLIANTGTIYARGGSGGDGGDAGATSLTGGNAGGGGAGCWSSAGFNGAGEASSGPGSNGAATTNACGAGGGSGGGGNLSVGGTGGAQGATDPHHYYIGQNYWF